MASFGSFALLVALVPARNDLLDGALALRLCAVGSSGPLLSEQLAETARLSVIALFVPVIGAAFALLCLGVFIYVFWPKRTLAPRSGKMRQSYLLESKDQIYENLRDLNFEYRSGKYSESEYEARREQLEFQAEQLMVEILDQQQDEEDLDGRSLS
jgi:hypothetical protein